MTEDQKKKISVTMKKRHAEGTHPGWAHINSRTDRSSFPERYMSAIFEYEGFSDLYTILKQQKIGKYFADFVVVELKVIIEIDGRMHFTTEGILHDAARNQFMSDLGWKVYRISWDDFSKDKKKYINDLKKYLADGAVTDKLYTIEELNLKHEKYIPGFKKSKNKKTYEDAQMSKISALEKSDIDFTKFGWVVKASKIIGLPTARVNKWMKRFMLNFYEDRCFKKNNKFTMVLIK
jgi:very-short-patch-repair endonuclease